MFKTLDPWIIGPIFIHKNYLFKVVDLQPTLPKCNENSNNGKKSFPF
jgi:hypothetical protein